MGKTINKKDVKDVLRNATLQDKLEFIAAIEESGVDCTGKKEKLIADDYFSILSSNGVNSVCPHCKSNHIAKDGKRSYTQRFLCKDCNKKFTLFTNTMLEKTKYPYFVWVDVVESV